MSQFHPSLHHWLLLSALILTLTMRGALGAPPVLDQATARQASHSKDIETASLQLKDLYRAGEMEAFLDHLEALATDTSLHPVAKERLVHDAAMLCSQAPPTPAVRAYVATLADRTPATYVWLDEGHHQVTVPLFDVGAAARFALRRWDAMAVRDKTILDLARGATDYLAMRPTDEAGRQGMLEAFEQAQTRVLLQQRDAIATALRTDSSLDRIALVVARRLGDKALFLDLAALARPTWAVRMVADIRSNLAPQEAFEVLRAAGARPAISSAALLQMGPLAGESPVVAQYLLQSLGDREKGGSAAVALSRLKDPAIARELGSLLNSADGLVAKRRAVLALKLDGGPAALSELHKFVANPRASATVKQEVEKWLTD